MQSIGSLEFKRKILEVKNQLADIFEKNISIRIDNFETINEEERINANRILEQLPALFESILCDNISKTLVNDAVHLTQLIFSDSQSTQLNEKVLTICIKEKVTFTIAREIEILKKEIESLL